MAHLLARARRRPLLAAGAFLLFLLFLEFPGVLLMRQVPFVSEMVAGSDLFCFSYPLRHLLGESLRHGHIPLWTEGINAGFPVHAEGQGGFLYPPNLLVALLPLVASINLSFVLTYLGAGLLLFLYAREIGQSRTGALFAATVFTFSGFMFSHIRHMNVIAVAQWLPLLLLLCERYVRTRRPLYLLALAPVQALQHLAGHPQVTYYCILFTGLYLGARVLQEARNGRVGERESGGVGERESGRAGERPAGECRMQNAECKMQSDAHAQPQAGDEGVPVAASPTLPLSHSPIPPLSHSPILPFPHSPTRALALAAAGFAVVTLIGAGMAGVQLVPTWELTQIASRPARGSMREAMFHTLPIPHLFTFVAPFFFGDPGRDSYSPFWGKDATVFWENTGYVGLVPLFLALFAAGALLRRNRWVALLAAGGALALLLALGKQTPLFPLLWRFVPGMDAFRVAGRFLLFTDFALAVLAGFGFDLLRRRLAATRPRLALAVPALLFALTIVDLLRFDARVYALVDARKWLSPPPVAQVIGRDTARTFTWHEADPWLEALEHHHGWQRNPDVLFPQMNTLLPNYNLLSGIPNFGYYSGFTIIEKGLLKGAASGLLGTGQPEEMRIALRLLGMHNVGSVLTPRNLAPGGARPVRAFAAPGSERAITLYRNPYTLPRAYVVARGEVIRDLRQARDRLLSPGFDPRTTVVVDDMSPLGNPKGKPPANAGWVRWLPGTSDRPAMDVMLTEHGWLVLSDFYYPGWLAWVDGKIVPLYRANVAGRAAPVPAGRHRVEFTYEPQSLQQGIALSAISLALLLGGLLAVMPRAKTK